MFQRRTVGLILASFAVALMAFSLLAHRWWGMKDGDETVSFGLRSVEMCDEDYEDGRTHEECRTMSLGKLFRGEYDEDDDYDDSYDDERDDRDFKEPSGFLLFGNLTFFGGIAAGALILICGGAVLMNPTTRASKGLGTATAVASAAYAGAGVLFVLMAPDQLKDVPYGMSIPLALIASGCGLAAGLILGNYDPAAEPRTIPTAHALTGLAPSKVPSLVLAGIGIVLVCGAIFTNTWWGRSEDDYRVAIGVREVESCMQRDRDYAYDSDEHDRGGERCQAETLHVREQHGDDDEDRESGSTFIHAGAATYHLGIMVCVMTLLAGSLMLAGQRVTGQLTPTSIVVGLAGAFALAGLVYVASKPSMMKDMHASFGPLLALAGGGSLIGAGVAMGRYAPPGATAPWASGPIGPMGPMGPMPPLAPMAPLAPLGAVPSPHVVDVRSGPVTPACPQCAAPMVFATQHGRWFCASCRIYA